MLVEGMLLGLTLSLLIGPLFFAIIQAGLEGGFRAGALVALGIWLSDALLAILTYSATAALVSLTALPHFAFWTGLAGGLLLIGFGVASLWKRPVLELPGKTSRSSGRSLWAHGLRGFLLNTVNPFTIFFWLSIGGMLAAQPRSQSAAVLFFGTMLGTLAVFDLLKAWGAKRLRQWLTVARIQQVQRGIGLLLIVFGVVLVVRSL